MNRLNCVHFNQDCSCFTVAHSRGFSVYNSDPVEQWVSRDFGPQCGLMVASVLNRTNYLALVGTGSNFPDNRLMVWNDQTQGVSVINYDSQVLNALISRDVVVAVLESSVHVASLAAPHNELLRIDTDANPGGIAALFNSTLVFPGRQRGQLAVVDLDKRQVTDVIACHRSQIAAVALNNEYIVTVSATGTLIRCQERSSGVERWFRRGLDRADIFSVAISPSSSRLAVLSDKQTLHVFDLGGSVPNEKHALANAPFAPKRYFGDEWSSARVKTRSKEPGVCGWTTDDTVIVLRPYQAQWEKYAMVDNGIVPKAWKAIR